MSRGAGKLRAWIMHTMWSAGWAPIGVFALHLVLGQGFHAYARFPNIDIPMHFLGGAAIGLFFHAASLYGSRCGVLGPYHRLTHTALVFGFTCVAAVLWEFAEFLADLNLGSHSQQGDLNDTLLDLCMGLVGGTALLVLLRLFGRLPVSDGPQTQAKVPITSQQD